MPDVLAVVPVLFRGHAQACIDSMVADDSAFGVDPRGILIVDNTYDGDGLLDLPTLLQTHRDPRGHNLGVARSWNIGARLVLDRNIEYLIIVSASMLFGPQMHTTWYKQMKTFWGHSVIECTGNGWHLIAFHQNVFKTIGLFDENFFPGYFEDIDFARRMHLTGGWQWIDCWTNCLTRGQAYHVSQNAIDVPAEPLLAYYAWKWGGIKGEEQYQMPFDFQPAGRWKDTKAARWYSPVLSAYCPPDVHPMAYWPERSIEELIDLYGLKRYW